MAIGFYNAECDYLPKGRVKIKEWIRHTIHNEGYRVGEITYIYCSQPYHLEINRQYLGHDYQTDIITFDYSDLLGRKVVGGDIFIDPTTVAENASTWKTTEREEELRVIIHGVLHLCGYKDKSPEEEATMRTKENFYLARWQELNK